MTLPRPTDTPSADTRLTVPAGERGIVRLFSLNMRPEEARFLTTPGALEPLLGAGPLDPAQLELITLSDLQDIGLAGYLRDGIGIPADQIDKAQLGALNGSVLLLRSRAFGGRAVALTSAPQLTLIATYSEPSTDWTAKPMPTDSAKLYTSGRTPPRVARAQARRIGFSLFAVMMTLIAFVVYKVVT